MRSMSIPGVESASDYTVTASSFLGGEVLSSDVPVSGGSITVDTSQVMEQATLRVPRFADGSSFDWKPGSKSGHPLAKNGQELAFTVHMGAARIPLGYLRIVDWTVDGGDIVVKLRGVMERAREARLTRPTVPRKDGTFVSELRRLMPAAIPVDISGDLVDRDVPASFTWSESRIDAITNDLLGSWPAWIRPDGFGGVEVFPALEDADWVSVATFTDGEGGTVVSAPQSDTREGVFNGVIARAQSDDPDAALVQGEAWVTSGPYDRAVYGDVPRFFTSPALKTAAQCESAAASLLAKSLNPGRTVEVQAATDPRVQLFDPVTVISDGVEYHGWVLGYRLPFTVDGGDMTLTVGVFESVEVGFDYEALVTAPGVCSLVYLDVGVAVPIGACWTQDEDGYYLLDSEVVELDENDLGVLV